MKLSEEDTSKVMANDLPEQSEYSQVLYDAQEVGKLANSHIDFERCQEYNRKAWRGIVDLMAACIARGMRLAREV